MDGLRHPPSLKPRVRARLAARSPCSRSHLDSLSNPAASSGGSAQRRASPGRDHRLRHEVVRGGSRPRGDHVRIAVRAHRPCSPAKPSLPRWQRFPVTPAAAAQPGRPVTRLVAASALSTT